MQVPRLGIPCRTARPHAANGGMEGGRQCVQQGVQPQRGGPPAWGLGE